MSVSLMSLLGGKPNLSANNHVDEAGKVKVNSIEDDAGFKGVMAAEGEKSLIAEKAKNFFAVPNTQAPKSDGLNAKVLLAHTNLSAHIVTNGQNLPSENNDAPATDLLSVGTQDLTPLIGAAQAREVVTEADAKPLLERLMGLLPERELTPEELSEIVQKTGLAPYAIFEALQDTPAASPNLAGAMVENMGSAEDDALGYITRPLLQPVTLAGALQQMEATEQVAANTKVAAEGAGKIVPQTMAEKANVLAQILTGLDKTASADMTLKASAVAHIATGEVNPKNAQAVAAPLVQGALQKTTEKSPVSQPIAVQPIPTPQATPPQSNVQAQAAAVSNHATPEDTADNDAGALKTVVGNGYGQGNTQAPQGQGTQPDFANVLRATEVPNNQPARPLDNAQAPQAAPKMLQPAITEQVSVRLSQAMKDGTNQMEIKLNPAELGRVDVKIQTAADGQTHVTITVEKRDTMDALIRDARALEHALRDTGMKTDSQNLQFNLRGDDQQHAKSQQQGEGKESNGQEARNGGGADDLDEKLSASEMALTYDAGRAYSLNLEWGVDISA